MKPFLLCLLCCLSAFGSSAAIREKRLAPVLHSVVDKIPEHFYLPQDAPSFGPVAGPRRVRYEKGTDAFYRQKRASGIAMLITGSAMEVCGLYLLIALFDEGAFFGKPDNLGLSTGFSLLSLSFILAGAALLYSGIVVRKRYAGKHA